MKWKLGRAKWTPSGNFGVGHNERQVETGGGGGRGHNDRQVEAGGGHNQRQAETGGGSMPGGNEGVLSMNTKWKLGRIWNGKKKIFFFLETFAHN